MRTVVLFDIHGNLAALDAVLDAAASEGYDEIVCGGDVCVFGPEPAACVDRLRDLDGIGLVQGNTDRYLWNRVVPGATAPGDFATIDWYRDALGPERLAWLGSMPHAQVLAQHDARVVHASPRSDEDSMLPDTPLLEIATKLGGVREQTVLFGHVHLQFRRTIEPWEIVNPGAVGLPFDGNPDSGWALLENGQVHLRRTPYDREATIAALEASGEPSRERTLCRLREARS
jgi:predicted phosphodiesterase